MEKENLEALKCRTNIPELIEFVYNEPKTGVGQYGEWYCYKIINRGENKVFFPTKFLNDKLQQFAPLQGKTLEVVLIEVEGNKKDWRVKDPSGTSPNATKSPTSPVTGQSGTSQSSDEVKALKAEIEAMSTRMDKMAEWATGVATKEDLVNLEKKFRTLLVDLRGEEAVELHTSMEAPKKFVFNIEKTNKTLQDPENAFPNVDVPEGL